MNQSKSDSYAAAGVDITAGYRAVELMKRHIGRTVTPGVVGDVGGFGGLFCPDLDGHQVARPGERHRRRGHQAQAGLSARPATTPWASTAWPCASTTSCAAGRGRSFSSTISPAAKTCPSASPRIVAGVAEGCVQAGCALIGGETAEMPGFYPEDEYDLAGFCRRPGRQASGSCPTSSVPARGTCCLASPSSGLHSNGFSLVRRVFDVEHARPDKRRYDELERPLAGGDAAHPHRASMSSPCWPSLRPWRSRASAHITGGGFYRKHPARPALQRLAAKIDKAGRVTCCPSSTCCKERANIPERDMFNTFNMGVGMTRGGRKAARPTAPLRFCARRA